MDYYWIDQNGNHVMDSYEMTPVIVPEYTGKIILHASGRRVWNPCYQDVWSKAWVTDEKGNGVTVRELTTSLYSWIDGGNQSRSKTARNSGYVAQGPFRGKCPFCLCVSPDQLCFSGSIGTFHGPEKCI